MGQCLLPLTSGDRLVQNTCRNRQYCGTFQGIRRVHGHSVVLRTSFSVKIWTKEYTMHRTKSLSHLGTAICLGVWLCTQLTAPVAAQDRIGAKVGIEVLSSGQASRPASTTTTETVRAGDFLRVYVIPEDDAYVYIVNNDGKTLTLLNAQEAQKKVPKRFLITFPAPPTEVYEIVGKSDKESITVICSPTEVDEVVTLFRTTNVPQKDWTALETKLMNKSKIDLTQPAGKTAQIAGNVRGMPGNVRGMPGNVRSLHNDAFVDMMPIFSGRTLVVKRYDFQVQK